MRYPIQLIPALPVAPDFSVGIALTPLASSAKTSPPVAARFVVADAAVINKNAVDAVVNVLANDITPTGGTLSLVSLTPPGHGTATVDGSVVKYTPTTDYVGLDRWEYTASDGLGNTDSAAVIVYVKAPDSGGYFLDTFTGGGDGSLIATHTSDSGAAYTPFSEDQFLMLSGSGTVYPDGASNYSDASPVVEIPTEAYFVELEVVIPTLGAGSDPRLIALSGRIRNAPNAITGAVDQKFVDVVWDSFDGDGRLVLGYFGLGVFSPFAVYTTGVTLVGTHVLRMEFTSTTVEVFLDGTSYGTSTFYAGDLAEGTGGYIAFGATGYVWGSIVDPFQVTRFEAGPLTP